MKAFQLPTFISILFFFVFSFSESKAQTTENEKLIPCESTDVHTGRLYNDSWHCIINTDKEFRKIIGGKSGIDFTKYTLIGVIYSSGGCKSPAVSHSIYYSQTNNSYRYELNIQQNGYCKPLFSGNVWCLVPKIENETKVDFVRMKQLNRRQPLCTFRVLLFAEPETSGKQIFRKAIPLLF